MAGKTFERIPERLLQALFAKVAAALSAGIGLLGDTNKLIISSDGTCIESNSSSYGFGFVLAKVNAIAHANSPTPMPVRVGVHTTNAGFTGIQLTCCLSITLNTNRVCQFT